jgi:hypothetical protein
MNDVKNQDRRQIINLYNKLVQFKNAIYNNEQKKYKDIIANYGEETSVLLSKLLLENTSLLYKQSKKLPRVIKYLSINAHNLMHHNKRNLEHFTINNLTIYKKSEQTVNGFQHLLACNNKSVTFCESLLVNTCVYTDNFEDIDKVAQNARTLPMGMIYSVSNLEYPYTVEAKISEYLASKINKKLQISRNDVIRFVRNKLGGHQDNFQSLKDGQDHQDLKGKTDQVLFENFQKNPEILYASILEIGKDLVYSILRKDPFIFSSEDL